MSYEAGDGSAGSEPAAQLSRRILPLAGDSTQTPRDRACSAHRIHLSRVFFVCLGNERHHLAFILLLLLPAVSGKQARLAFICTSKGHL